MRRLIMVLLALTACTPTQQAAWHQWHRADPTAAVDYLYDHGLAARPGETVEQASVSLSGACSQWADEASAAGWSSSDWPTVDRIMYAESRCQPGAYNPTAHFGGNASGLMQIIWPTWAAECGDGDIFDPVFNLECALYLKTTYGWRQWATY